MTPEQSEEMEIRDHMARAFFASAWADACEEAEESEMISGREIMEVMPDEIDPAAIHAARTLAIDVVRANGKSLFDLMAIVERDGDGDRANTAEMFGHYLAMQAMGHGVGLSDAFGDVVADAIKVPYVEFGAYSLERDYF
jgi:hypothetical protein